MRGVFFTELGEATATDAYGRLALGTVGTVEARLVTPEEFPLWLVRASLDPGAGLVWDGDRGDESVYVLEGEVAVDGRACPAGGALTVEAGATATLSATGSAHLVHMGRHERATPAAGGRNVHVVGPGGTYARLGDGRATRYFADSACATCGVTLFFTGRDGEHASPAHSHSCDELIHVTSGEIVVGRRRLGPGSTVAVLADRRYAFHSPGFGFLNYRPAAATMTVDRAAPPLEEGPVAHGFDVVMDLR